MRDLPRIGGDTEKAREQHETGKRGIESRRQGVDDSFGLGRHLGATGRSRLTAARIGTGINYISRDAIDENPLNDGRILALFFGCAAAFL
ncbi:hypothetical protein [Sphingomonas caeni]|uniref:hypothetical protein n=1 Tax=Sphingomonas caeni TaxID=2984949 RepID=UPI0029F53387|nr:hypothetical protein [Sphingomonas caeni]